MLNKRKIAVVIVDRANYGRLKPVMKCIRSDERLEMQVICSGTMVLERFGSPIEILEQDNFKIDSKIFVELEGSTPTTMAKSVGFAVIEFASEFQRLNPDVVLIIGDRYEAFAAAIAASYMNICIAHIQGGEVSGSIDESARHCISKLAHYHFPATKRAADYLVRMGELENTVYHVGCPSGDLALKQKRNSLEDILKLYGTGREIDTKSPYLLVVYHPVTTNYGVQREEAEQIIESINQLGIQTVWLWPNIDAGSDQISKALRACIQQRKDGLIRFVKTFTPDDYLEVLANTSCAIGNSSSFVRDSSFFGTPVVLIGDRQQGREHAENVTPISLSVEKIITAVKEQIKHGPYQESDLYGAGDASEQICEKLTSIKPYAQKRLNFVPQSPLEH